MSKAKLISVSIETGDTGMLFATSKEMKSLFVTARNDQDLRSAISLAVVEIFQYQGLNVDVYEVDNENFENYWAIIGKDEITNQYSDF